MPDLGDLLDFDFTSDGDTGSWWNDFGDGDGNILDQFASGADDVGDYYFDSETGEVVSAADAQALADSPVSRSTSDMLRSMEGAPAGTLAPGREAFDWTQMADPSASIASAGGMDWLKALGQGLTAAKGLLGGGSGQGGLAGLAQDAGRGGAAISGLPGLMSAGTPQVGGVGAPDISRVGAWSQPDLTRPDIASAGGMSQPDIARVGGMMQADIPGGARMQDAIHAALAQGQADLGMRLGLQGAIDAGPIRDQFDPLVMPFAPIGGAVPPAQHLSGLQRLALERMG